MRRVSEVVVKEGRRALPMLPRESAVKLAASIGLPSCSCTYHCDWGFVVMSNFLKGGRYVVD